MVARMDEVELQPLVHAERAKHWVIDDFHAAKLCARFGSGRIEPLKISSRRGQHSGQIELSRRNNVLWRLASGGKVSKVDQNERRDLLLDRLPRRDRRLFLDATFETFRGAEVRPLQVLDHFGNRPALWIPSHRAFGSAAARGVFEDRETLLQMPVHGRSVAR